MKRKEVDELYDDCSPTCLSNPKRKFRRLDAEFVSVMDEDPNVNAPRFVERGLSPELPWTSTSMVHTDAVSVETPPTSNAMEERALMPYDPTKTPFAKYPSLQKLPIVVQSDLIPGLKGNCADSKLELFTAFGLTLISVVIFALGSKDCDFPPPISNNLLLMVESSLLLLSGLCCSLVIFWIITC